MIDAHHHFWKYSPEQYGWIDSTMDVLKRDYLPVELEEELQAAGVTGTVAVQARQSLEETRWLLELAERHAFIKGVVGWFDLCSGALDTQLNQFTSCSKLVGVRHVIQDEPDERFMLRPDFRAGISCLEIYDLTYDLLLYPRHLKHALKLARLFPRQRFILDHLGKPPIRSGVLEPWKSDLGRLAECPNVWCKLSGMVTEADLQNWSYGDLLPYMETVLEAFGAGRIMVGSDWPVCTLAGSYQAVMKIVTGFTASLSGTDRTKIWIQNAMDCYQLKQ
jgi:L-fuconolactonase